MTKTKRIIQIILLLIVTGSIGYLIAKEISRNQTLQAPAKAATSAKTTPKTMTDLKPDRVEVYYFHSNARCATCHHLEEYARESIETGFANDIKSGNLVFQSVNVDLPENQHFVKDFKLFTKSLILVAYKNGQHIRHVDLDKIWDYVRDRDIYQGYVQKETRALLDEVLK